MLKPDKELALGILAALDSRSGSSAGPPGCGPVRERERAWLEQECGLIDGLYAWLEREKRQSRHDPPLQQAITTLCDRLSIAKDALLQDLDGMDGCVEQARRVSQEGGIGTPAVAPSGARKNGQ